MKGDKNKSPLVNKAHELLGTADRLDIAIDVSNN